MMHIRLFHMCPTHKSGILSLHLSVYCRNLATGGHFDCVFSLFESNGKGSPIDSISFGVWSFRPSHILGMVFAVWVPSSLSLSHGFPDMTHQTDKTIWCQRLWGWVGPRTGQKISSNLCWGFNPQYCLGVKTHEPLFHCRPLKIKKSRSLFRHANTWTTMPWQIFENKVLPIFLQQSFPPQGIVCNNSLILPVLKIQTILESQCSQSALWRWQQIW